MRKHHAPMSRGFLVVTVFFCAFLLTGCEETVSKKQYEDALAENARLKSKNTELQNQLNETVKERDALQVRLNTAKMQRVEFLLSKLSTAEKQVEAANRRALEMEKAGFNAGALAVYRSIQITGRPSVVRGWFIDDWYYDFNVEIGGNILAKCRVETTTKGTPVTQGLSAAINVVPLLK